MTDSAVKSDGSEVYAWACACLLVQLGSQVALQHCSAEEQSVGIRRLERTPWAASFCPKFPNPQGRKETSLVSSRSVQHTPAMSCAIQVTVALSQVRSSLWKCFTESEIVASAVVGVAEESVISDRERPLSSRELLILPFLVVWYFLSFPSPVKGTFVYSSGCQAPAWQLCAACLSTRKEDLQEGCPWESWVQPQLPSAAPRRSLQCSPSPILLSPSINGSGSWEPWLSHHFAPCFPSSLAAAPQLLPFF